MKRYITIVLRDANLVLSVINNMSTAIRNGNDAYHWLKTKIDNRQISIMTSTQIITKNYRIKVGLYHSKSIHKAAFGCKWNIEQ